jgi:hypothetical protein
MPLPNVVNALILEQANGLAHAIKQGEGGSVGYVAGGVGAQHVGKVKVDTLALGSLPGVESLYAREGRRVSHQMLF